MGKEIGLSGVENARQLGGYRCAGGKKIRDGVLLRSGKPSGATQEDIRLLTGKYRLTKVIDLRMSGRMQGRRRTPIFREWSISPLV